MSARDIPMSQWPSTHEFVIPVADGPDTVTVTIDGREAQVPRGELLIKAAQERGTYIPRFCWHERMKPVGMCRMCLVEVEGMRGLQISCATPVTDGMVVHTQSAGVKKVQDGVLEFLLINHPLDCPVCDRGGECPLQDQTLAFGPGESRYVEEKRHWAKPIPLSELVMLDRERCIQCGRCTRFAGEIAGDPLIDFGARGAATEVITYPGEPFSSHFAGNTVQICPVGALTASPYRFRARPWDLATVETSCETCAVQCRGALQSSSNRLVRLLGVDSEPVNHGWLCDKGRYALEWVHSPNRIVHPMIRKNGELVEASWPEALDAAADGLRQVLDLHGPQSVAALGGARGTNEDQYVWTRFLKGVLRTDNVDAQLGDGLPAEVVLGLPHATIADLDRARAIVLVAPDLKQELPVLYLRVRRAAVDLDVPLIDCSSRDDGLTKYATAVLRHGPGEQAAAVEKLVHALDGATPDDDAVRRGADAISGRDGDIVVILGRPSVAEPADATVLAAAALSGLPNVRFLSALRRGNVHGALDLGLAPGFLPGRVTLEAGSAGFIDAWGAVPEARGLDATGILQAASQGKIRALVLHGCDPIADFPDRTLARDAFDKIGFHVAVGAFLTDSSRHADVVLPCSLWGEKPGSATNIEGRVQRLGQKVSPEGPVMSDWRIASELAARFGDDFDLESVEEIQDEIARVAPAYSGITARLLALARDGAVVPIAEHPDEIVVTSRPGASSDLSWEPIQVGASQEGDPASSGPTAAVEAATGAATTLQPGLAAPEGGDHIQAAAAAAEELAATVTTETGAPPELYRWDRQVEAWVPPPRDAYALRLVTGRELYDGGRIVRETPSLAPLARGCVLLVNRADRDRIGVPDGGEVKVTTARGSRVFPVRADVAIPPGVGFLAINQPGAPSHPGGMPAGPSDLIDVDAPITDLRVESIR